MNADNLISIIKAYRTRYDSKSHMDYGVKGMKWGHKKAKQKAQDILNADIPDMKENKDFISSMYDFPTDCEGGLDGVVKAISLGIPNDSIQVGLPQERTLDHIDRVMEKKKAVIDEVYGKSGSKQFMVDALHFSSKNQGEMLEKTKTALAEIEKKPDLSREEKSELRALKHDVSYYSQMQKSLSTMAENLSAVYGTEPSETSEKLKQVYPNADNYF